MTTITIPKKFTHGDELIIVSRKEYDKLCREYAEVKDALSKIRISQTELKAGKTKTVKSLAQLL